MKAKHSHMADTCGQRELKATALALFLLACKNSRGSRCMLFTPDFSTDL